MLQINLDTKLNIDSGRINRDFNNMFKEFLNEIAQDAVSIVRDNMPRDTGNLRRSTIITYGRSAGQGRSERVVREFGDDYIGDDLAEDFIASDTIDRRTSVHITPTAYYAGFVEYGTRFQSPQYFMRRSMEAIDSIIQSKLSYAFDGWADSWQPLSGSRSFSSSFSTFYAMGGGL